MEVETPMMQPIPGGAASPVHHPPQRARPDAVPAHRAGAVPEAPGGGRARARLRDQPQFPQRGAVEHPPQPEFTMIELYWAIRRTAT